MVELYEALNTICAVIAGVLFFIDLPISIIALVVKAVTKKPVKKVLTKIIIYIILFVISIVSGAFVFSPLLGGVTIYNSI